MLLVHGATDDHRKWNAAGAPMEQQHYRVFAMDRRGRGHSGDAPAYAFERKWEDVAAVIAGIGGPSMSWAIRREACLPSKPRC